jgi:hypothetical protein
VVFDDARGTDFLISNRSSDRSYGGHIENVNFKVVNKTGLLTARRQNYL